MSGQSSRVLRHAPFCRLQLKRRAPKTMYHRRMHCLLPRKGAATLEFALVSPIVFFIVLASIQFAGLLMSQNVLTAAAREGGRVASMPSTVSDATVITAVQDRLSRGGVDPALISVVVGTPVVGTPTAWANLDTGDEVTVSVSGSMREMSWIGAVSIIPGTTLSSEITYERE